MRIFNWIFAVFCMLCLPVYGFHPGAVLMFLLGIASLPVKPVRKIWKKLPKSKVLRPVLLGVLFFVFCSMIPTGSNPAGQTAELSTESVVAIEESVNKQAKIQETEKQEPGIPEIVTEETESETETETEQTIAVQTQPSTEVTILASDIPVYSGKPYVEINDNVPYFRETDLSVSSYEYYSDLDDLGRCGVVYACIGTDLMPTEERGNIGAVKPTGWHTVKYDVVDGKYLYNRCHLIGYQLSGENANTKNLITGTRYLNVDGMLPFENMVADYVKETGNHVMYRATPVFEGDNLLASGVQIEAESVEDKGEGILFNVYCYNVQPDVEIDYATGDSSLLADAAVQSDSTDSSGQKAAVTSDESVETEKSTVSAGDGITDSGNTGSENESMSSGSDASGSVTNDTGSGSGGSDTLMVWKSATGSKYHSINNCGNMNPDKATQITEAQAISQGLGKCSKCW